jgi:cyclopropane fatty-acyl-phospholipid synthase-like methyltransferase
MHTEAFNFVGRYATDEAIKVIEIGARNINGTCRPHFQNATYTGLDLYPGQCVDIVIDAAHFIPAERVDIVLIIEVLEHAANWQELIRAAASWLTSGGKLIITCAGPGRPKHSAIDGGPTLHRGEHYGNLTTDQLAECMASSGLENVITSSDRNGRDSQAVGAKK